MINLRPHQCYDIVIVGASFAGLSCARTAAMRGLKVLVVDQKKEAGARVRTTGILVKEAADELDIPAELTRKVRGVRLYAPRHKPLDFFSPGYYFLSTETAKLLRWMALDAELCGAKMMFGATFKSAERVDGGFYLPGLDLYTRFLVGADGAKSRVAESLGLGQNRRFIVGMESEYEPMTSLDGRFLHCFLDSRIAPGYIGWAVPGVSVTQVGLATRRLDKPHFNRFVDHLGKYVDMKGARALDRRSGLIPTGGLVKPFSANRALLIGDAAGLVSPLTGGGIQLAFRFGRRAAQAVSDYLCDGGGEPGQVLAAEYPRFTFKRLMRVGMDLALPNWMMSLGSSLPLVKLMAHNIYFHQRGTPGEPLNPGMLDQFALRAPANENGV